MFVLDLVWNPEDQFSRITASTRVIQQVRHNCSEDPDMTARMAGEEHSSGAVQFGSVSNYVMIVKVITI